MNPFEMVVAIIVVVTIGRVIRAKYQSGRYDSSDSTTSAETARMREQIHALKDRIAVLERVVTDSHGSVNLDREIEKLRDNDRV